MGINISAFALDGNLLKSSIRLAHYDCNYSCFYLHDLVLYKKMLR